MSSYNSPESAYEHALRQHGIPHPRSNYDGQSQFGDHYTNDQYNPETWPAEYAYTQQSPNPTQTYSDAHAPGWSHHGRSEATLPVSRRGNESSISASCHSPAVSRSALSNGSRTAPRFDFTGPPNYVLVPQNTSLGSASFLFPPIEFKPTGLEYPGIFIGRPVRAQHTIESSNIKMSRLSPVQEITIKIRWPGYPEVRYPFERRLGNVGRLTRGELLDVVCGVVVEYVQALKDNHARTTKEHARWAISGRALRVDRFFVAQLHHLGGEYFQPEIWVPRPREE